MAVPIAEKLKEIAGKAAGLLPPAGTGLPKTGRILVVEQMPGNRWKAVEAEIGDEITVLDARTIENGDQRDTATLLSSSEETTIALIPDSRRSVCRLIDVAGASPDQVERMVALRLEVELPYPAAESTWVCEPCLNGRGATSRALLIATATSEIAKAERALGAAKKRSIGIEFAPAGLAELALAHAPSDGTVAVAGLDRGEALLVLVHGGTLAYTRHIRIEDAAQDADSVHDTWAPQFARDVKQSLYDYLLRTGNGGPECLFLVGKPMLQPAFLHAVETKLELPVRRLESPGQIRVAKPGLEADALLAEYPVCLGILLARLRRGRGERTTSPAIRRERRGFRAFDWRSRIGVLAGLNALLLAVLIASLVAVHAAKVNADERLVRESQSLLGGLQRLREEVTILRYEAKQVRPVVDVIAALAEALPAEIEVETLAIDLKGKVTIAGKTKTVELARSAISTLNASKAFTNAQFHGATLEKDKFSFQITCELSGGGRGFN